MLTGDAVGCIADDVFVEYEDPEKFGTGNGTFFAWGGTLIDGGGLLTGGPIFFCKGGIVNGAF